MMVGGGDARVCVCDCPSVENYDGSAAASVEEEEEEEEEEKEEKRNQNHHDSNNSSSNGTRVCSSSSNSSSSLIVSSSSSMESCRTLLQQQQQEVALQQSLIYLETIDGDVEEVEREVALLLPLVQREVVRHGRGGSRNIPVLLPKQVSSGALKLLLDYCRFHGVPGHSDKERKVFDEKFVRLDTRRLCELTSAADSMDMKPLGDLTSRALARMIEGKTPEQIREIFHLPDDLTEEEKLEPVKITTDDPRIRLLNRLYARKHKELQEKKLLKSGSMESGQRKQVRDERSVEELVSFIDGNNKSNRLGKGKRNKNRQKKETTEENNAMSTRPPQEADASSMTAGTVNVISGKEKKAVKLSTAGRMASRIGSGLETSSRVPSSRENQDNNKVFEDAEFDDDDDFDPALKEIVDREVEDFARRLNSNWLKHTEEILMLAEDSTAEHRISEPPSVASSAAGSKARDRGSAFYEKGRMGNGHSVCSVPKGQADRSTASKIGFDISEVAC